MQKRNPHFDDHRVAWSDQYSGQYLPPVYEQEFELQWNIALNGNPEYYQNPGTSLDDHYIDDRVYEWTGVHPRGFDGFGDGSMSVRRLDHTIPTDLISGKKCVDVGCGMGRWTRTMQKIGAQTVLSIDVSPSALASTARYNPNVLRADVVTLDEVHPELKTGFDFGNFWGVCHHTHDPARAFRSAAGLIKPGGALYLMVYHPDGIHGQPMTMARRRQFHTLKNVSDRLAYVDKVYDRHWDNVLTLKDNVFNQLRNVLGRHKGSKHGWLDLMEPFYNWTIPLPVIEQWFASAGFKKITILNDGQADKAAWHVLGENKKA
jgi:SAM-dependent methyltransferase